jgi:hypothetical protein
MKVFTESEDKLPLNKRDISTQGLYILISKKVKEWKINVPKIEDIKVPSDNLVREKAKVAKTFPIPVSDEDMGGSPFVNKAINVFLSKLPIRDLDEEWSSPEYAHKLLSEKFSEILPEKNLLWKDAKSDTAMTNLAFHGLGAHKLRNLIRDKDNYGAYLGLSNKGGIGHRAWAFTYEGIVACIAHSLSVVKIQTFPQFLKLFGLESLKNKSAFVQDHSDLWEVMRNYTKSYCDVFYKGEALANDPDIRKWWVVCSNFYPQVHFPPINTAEDVIDLLTIFIFEGSAVHEHIGAVAEYIEDPEFLTTKIRKGKTISDVQATYQVHILMAATGMKQPALMSNFKHLFLEQHKEEVDKIFDKFQDDLQKLSIEIDHRNTQRSHPYHSANPSKLESSVSI